MTALRRHADLVLTCRVMTRSGLTRGSGYSHGLAKAGQGRMTWPEFRAKLVEWGEPAGRKCNADDRGRLPLWCRALPL
jgi:hypothetical protein